MDQNKNEHQQFHTYENYSPGHPVTPAVKKKRFARADAWLHKHRIVVLVALVTLILGIGGALIYGFNSLTFYASTGDPVVLKEKKIYSELTGAEVTEKQSKRPVTAIMIENSPDARPQSGLKESGAVFEAIAEGGITRFLVLYQEDAPQLIGPVRSLRPYYVDWLAPFDASVAHVGGSVKALAEIRNGSYKDIDQFFNADSYWRAKDRYAPHNVYTSFDRLDALNKKKGYTSSEFEGFARVEDTPAAKKKRAKATAAKPGAISISVNISAPLYNSSYTYDKASNSYVRSQGGAPHADREAGSIAPNVVIVIETALSKVFEDGYRESYQTTGSGKAYVFQNGTVTEGTWSKSSKTAQMEFKDTAGKTIELERGQTWITAIDPSKSVTWQ